MRGLAAIASMPVRYNIFNMNYIPEVLPKGTTLEQWEQYAKDMERHEKYYNDREPDPTDYPSEQAYNAAMSEWNMNRSCFEPNKPGYYRANNH